MENSIRLRQAGESLILDLIGDGINSVDFDLHLKYLKNHKCFKYLYVNLAYLKFIDNDVMNKFHKLKVAIKDKNICFINVNAMNNCILNLFKADKMFQLYMNKQDAVEAKRPLVNRNFKIVS